MEVFEAALEKCSLIPKEIIYLKFSNDPTVYNDSTVWLVRWPDGVQWEFDTKTKSWGNEGYQAPE
jgi:hypothetical protein